jgi:hypothetical protein
MEISKRAKKVVRFETVNTDELDIPIEQIERTEELDAELRRIADCYRPSLSKRQRRQQWEDHLRSQEDNVEVIDDRPVENLPAAPQPLLPVVTELDVKMAVWLQEADLESLLAKPSFAFIDYQNGRVFQTLRINVESYLNREFKQIEFDRLMQQTQFSRQLHSLQRTDGDLLVYSSQKAKLVLYFQKRRLLHYWIFPIK